MKSFVSRMLLSAMLFAVAACGSDGPTIPKNVGVVKGVVYAADGVTPIPQATVTVLSEPASAAAPAFAVEDGMPSTVTDVNGRYTLNNVPLGPQTIRAKRGVFEVTFTVDVKGGTTVTAPGAELVSVGKLAYLPGSFDSIEDIVQGELGNAMEQLAPADFASATKLAEYRMIFVNCGADVYDMIASEATLATIRTWVSNGGIMYASDWANELVEALYPADFSGSLQGDEQAVTATLVDTKLKNFVGKSTVPIQYDLGAWRTPETLSAAVKVLVRGTFAGYETTHSNAPLAVQLPKGTGSVVFTSFHNEAGVTVDQKAVLRYFIYLE